jgi:DNA-binding MarR family transcriptional regulator
VSVELTPVGRDLIEPLFARHADDIAAAMGELNGEELQQLSDLLRRLGLAAESEVLEVGEGAH